MNNMIDLTPYLPKMPAKQKKSKRTINQTLSILSFAVESAVTLGIGLCLVLGLIVTVSIL